MNDVDYLLNATAKILRPLVRLLINNRVSADTLTRLVRQVFVEVAAQEFKIKGEEQTISRISVLSGINRKETSRLLKLSSAEAQTYDIAWNRAARVMSAWLRDEAFHDQNGEVLTLPFSGEGVTFTSLVEKHSGDMKPRTIADELLSVGAIERREDGLRMTARGYIPGATLAHLYEILGEDTAELMMTITHNLNHTKAERLYQRKVLYDNVSPEHVKEFIEYSSRLSQALLEELNHWLAQRDHGEERSERRCALGLGIFQIVKTHNNH